MKINVCIGSSCHLKGSREVVTALQRLIQEHDLGNEISLSGRFCMGNCQKGVSVEIDKELHSVNALNVDSVFNNVILTKIKKR